ncbi:mitochondrial protein C2orf69 homolog [Erpetoichthys calabaricus]|uniref:Chromosome 2 open reading frame 69 n=1 Tax=Erpetoichthys calabaricus TaxID=27687 RepID=A0A8C4T4N4_ERPCA|nr:mitochondrial protein C2orf69 homolog [Erpetoichthys calabaricus]
MFGPRAVVALSAVAFVRNMNASATTAAPGVPGLLRLHAVQGYEVRRCNEMLLLRPGGDSPTSGRHVLYFPGDIQNFHEVMASHHENHQWLPWSLENVAVKLSKHFPGSHVWVIRASRMYLHKFSCYDNFVESSLFGAPEHSSGYGAFLHLQALFVHAFELAKNPLDSVGINGSAGCAVASNSCYESQKSSSCNQPSVMSSSLPANLTLTLVGFSKGCVVLNQLIYELAGARANSMTSSFVKHITDMYWLDGGHPGGSDTWVTKTEVLKELASSGIAVHCHVTPYEVRDPMRAWVGKEHSKFAQTLKELGAPIVNMLHFENEKPSLENHFRVLEMISNEEV